MVWCCVGGTDVRGVRTRRAEYTRPLSSGCPGVFCRAYLRRSRRARENQVWVARKDCPASCPRASASRCDGKGHCKWVTSQ